MPQGLKTSVATWQRFINRVVGEDLKPYVFVYLDNIILISNNFEHHMSLLESVLSRLEAAGLVICQNVIFAIANLNIYVVNENGLQVEPEKVRAIADFRRPHDPRFTKRLAGMLASGYRRSLLISRQLWLPCTGLWRRI